MNDSAPLAPAENAPWWLHDFVALCAVDDPDRIPLDRAATLLGAHRSRHLVDRSGVDETISTLDRLANRCAEPTIEAWRRLLWIKEGFSGNGIDYHDVRNSFVPDVLDRRVGIPISIAVVGIAVGRRLGLRVQGIAMPGHFLLGVNDDGRPGETNEPSRFVDPFHGGALLDEEGTATLFRAMFGDQTFQPSYLLPTGTIPLLVRMLANLKQNYANSRDLPGLVDVLRLRTSLPGWTLLEGRELVRLLHVRGEISEAIATCDQLDDSYPGSAAIIDEERRRIVSGLN